MAQKLAAQTEVNFPADQFFSLYKGRAHVLPKASPDKVKDVKLVQGDWGTQGSVKHWTYLQDGKEVDVKFQVEELDEANRKVTFNCLDAELMKYYNSLKASVEVTPKDNKSSLVNLAVEYEKLNANAPDPQAQLDFAVKLTKDFDGHLVYQHNNIMFYC